MYGTMTQDYFIIIFASLLMMGLGNNRINSIVDSWSLKTGRIHGSVVKAILKAFFAIFCIICSYVIIYKVV